MSTTETKAEYAYGRFLEKRKMIADLEFECELLRDKYFSEMQRAGFPVVFSETMIREMFAKDKDCAFARDAFLKMGFTPDFLRRHKIEFVEFIQMGYHATAMSVVLGIGDYEYTIEFPQPQNVYDDKDRNYLMGMLKFRADRLHKSKKNESVRQLEPVQMPTYEWTKCFEAIEAIVDSDDGAANAVKQEKQLTAS